MEKTKYNFYGDGHPYSGKLSEGDEYETHEAARAEALRLARKWRGDVRMEMVTGFDPEVEIISYELDILFEDKLFLAKSLTDRQWEALATIAGTLGSERAGAVERHIRPPRTLSEKEEWLEEMVAAIKAARENE